MHIERILLIRFADITCLSNETYNYPENIKNLIYLHFQKFLNHQHDTYELWLFYVY